MYLEVIRSNVIGDGAQRMIEARENLVKEIIHVKGTV